MKQINNIYKSFVLSSLIMCSFTSTQLLAKQSPELTGQIMGSPPLIRAGVMLPELNSNKGKNILIKQALDGKNMLNILTPGSEINLGSDFPNLYNFIDSDGDTPSDVQEITWYIVSPNPKSTQSWAPFGTKWDEVSSQYLSDKEDVSLEIIDSSHYKNNGTVLVVPNEALGKRIGLSITPVTNTGFPNKGKELFLTDLNYIYQQFDGNTIPSKNLTIDEITNKIIDNNFNNGGGEVMDIPYTNRMSLGMDIDEKNNQYRFISNYYWAPTSTKQTNLNNFFDDWSKWNWSIEMPAGYDCGECLNWSGVNNPDESSEQKQFSITLNKIEEETVIAFSVIPRNRYGIIGPKFKAAFTANPISSSSDFLVPIQKISLMFNKKQEPLYSLQQVKKELIYINSLSELSIENPITYTVYKFDKNSGSNNNFLDQKLDSLPVLCQGILEFDEIDKQQFISCQTEEKETFSVFNLNYFDKNQNLHIEKNIFTPLFGQD